MVLSSFVHHFIAICEFKLELQSRSIPFGSKSAIFVPCDLEILRMTSKNNTCGAPFLCHCKLCASFRSHVWIQTGVSLETPKLGQNLFWPVTLAFDLWPWPFARTSLLPMVITPENFLMIGWQNIVKKVSQTDRQTDGQTDRQTDGKKCS